MGNYFHTRKTAGRSRAGLTPTQIILLTFAKAGPIRMCRPDRLGTRCHGYEDDTGAALITAYSNPEGFLVARGLLRPRNQRHYFDITDAGRAAIAAAEAADLAAKGGR
jgi:hypothetical protein